MLQQDQRHHVRRQTSASKVEPVVASPCAVVVRKKGAATGFTVKVQAWRLA